MYTCEPAQENVSCAVCMAQEVSTEAKQLKMKARRFMCDANLNFRLAVAAFIGGVPVRLHTASAMKSQDGRQRHQANPVKERWLVRRTAFVQEVGRDQRTAGDDEQAARVGHATD